MAKSKGLRRASYRLAVEWIADNDEPLITNADEVANFISVLLTADIFGADPERVANDVIKRRALKKAA